MRRAVASLLLVSCSPDLPPAAPDEPPAPTAAPSAVPSAAPAASAAARDPLAAACDAGDASACFEAGVKHYQGEGVGADPPAALAFFLRACDGGSISGCFNAGLLEARGDGVPKDEAAARGHFERACAGDEATGCENLGVLLYKGLGGAQDQARAIPYFQKACDGGDRDGCFNLGVAHYKGEGVAADKEKAGTFMTRACELGEKRACDLAAEIAAEASDVAGANVEVQEVTVDGLTLRKVYCHVEGGSGLGGLGGIGGLIGSFAVAAGLGKKKAALDACAPKGATPRVRWMFVSGRTTKIAVEGVDGAVERCIERALRGMAADGDGECAATVLIGKQP